MARFPSSFHRGSRIEGSVLVNVTAPYRNTKLGHLMAEPGPCVTLSEVPAMLGGGGVQ